MKITVFGLGYVGAVTAACLAEDGHEVVGVDLSEAKVEQINRGIAPIVEDKIAELVSGNVASGRLRATTDPIKGLSDADIVFVCVGTPSRSDGSLDLAHVEAVARELGAALRGRSAPPLLVFRSTMLPGAMRDVVLPAIFGGGPGLEKLRVVYHPEFLREGSSVRDFYSPPKIVVGEREPGHAQGLLAIYGAKYEAPRIVCSVEEAEMVKYCDNLFHALKVTFANEIGMFCHGLGINSQRVMEMFCQDTKLNISHRYLRPGFAFGGSCLPKDLRAVLAAARLRSIELPMLQGMLASNRIQVERAASMVLASGSRRIGFFGLAFKEGTDDLRESPYVELAERLLGKGLSLTIFDPHVQTSRLIGRNKSYADRVLPHLASMVQEGVSALESCELVVACHRPSAEAISGWLAKGIRVFDLTGLQSNARRPGVQSIV
jgi:GDP-mannose 6-dehydrogenase